MGSRIILPADAAVDLHMHTFASDGRWEHQQLVDHIVEAGFRVIAVADHDTMHSVPGVLALAAERGVHVIPAVEVTTRWERENNRQVHVLVYGIDPDPHASTSFHDLVRLQQEQLRDTSERMIALVERHGRRIPSLPEIVGELPLTPHRVFTAMIRNGHGSNLMQAHNIVRALGEPVIVDVPIDETVRRAHESGGIAIIAHPGRDEGAGILDEEKLDRLLAEVPIDGVEAHYRSYKDADTTRYRDWAARHGLLVSAGSDSHWPNHPVNPTAHPARWIAPLLARLGYDVEPFEEPAWSPSPPSAEQPEPSLSAASAG